MEEIGNRPGNRTNVSRETEEDRAYRKTTPIRELEVYMPVRDASPDRAKRAQAARKSARMAQESSARSAGSERGRKTSDNLYDSGKKTRNLTELRERIPEADRTEENRAAASTAGAKRASSTSGSSAAKRASSTSSSSASKRASGVRRTSSATAAGARRRSIKKRMKRRDNIRKAVIGLLLLAICFVLVFGISRLVKRVMTPTGNTAHNVAKQAGTGEEISGSAGSAEAGEEAAEEGAQEEGAQEEAAEEVPEPVEEVINFTHLAEAAHAVSTTTKEAQDVSWNIYAGDEYAESWQRSPAIDFGLGRDYNSLPGICTFRGDNFRSGAAYGTADITEKKFSQYIWSAETGGLSGSYGGNYWSGCGWTGQCLIRQWDEETRKAMNLYEDKKNKDGLVEVIYATLDGNIYFFDLEDGKPTRDTIYCGMAFKGAGALDPRGYPLMYVGSGDNIDGIGAHMFIISLIDGSILWEYGDSDPVMLRYWTAFDSSPLVDAETDTLIWPGENGVFYTIKLNANYDKAAGTISINPELTARSTYMSPGGTLGWYIGMECSVAVIGNYAYVSENSGKFFCIDLNTMDCVWVQDTFDDNNSTPVVEFNPENGEGYVYSAPSLHWTANGDMSGQIGIYKMNAVTGEIVWKKDYDVWTVDGVSGGVQGTPAIGKTGTDLENLIFYPIARTPNMYDGKLVALDKKTGEEAWVFNMENYAWSSPVTIYDTTGKGYVVILDSARKGFLLDGATGEKLDTVDMGSNVEASPCVYNDTIVVGTRGNLIICLKVT